MPTLKLCYTVSSFGLFPQVVMNPVLIQLIDSRSCLEMNSRKPLLTFSTQKCRLIIKYCSCHTIRELINTFFKRMFFSTQTVRICYSCIIDSDIRVSVRNKSELCAVQLFLKQFHTLHHSICSKPSTI